MKTSRAKISEAKTKRLKPFSKKSKSVRLAKKKELPTHDSFGNPIRSLAAIKAKYELLDGDAPENQEPLPDDKKREWFFQLAGDTLSTWLTLPQAAGILEQRTEERIERQKEFYKLKSNGSIPVALKEN